MRPKLRSLKNTECIKKKKANNGHDNPRHPELTVKQAISHDHALPPLFSSLWRSNLITPNHLMTLNKDGSLRVLFFLQLEPRWS